MRTNHKILAAAGVVLALLLAFSLPAKAEPPRVGGTFPDMALPVPANEAHAKYLGLAKKGTFKVPDIPAKVVIVEVFSMYCPYCQAEAPILNTLYEKIEADSSLRGKVKMLGIGVGNSTFEVNFFGKKYQVPFPLFADNDFSIHKILGGVRTPYFIVLKNLPKGSHRVVFSEGGSCGAADDFLKKVKELGGL